MEYVRVIESLDHPIAEVWAMVASFGAIKTWISGVEACALEGEGVGAIRSVTRGGSVTRERLDLVDPVAHRLSYSLIPPYRLQAKDVRGTIALKALGPERTEFTWWSEASEIEGSPADLASYIGPFYRASIHRLAQVLAAGPDTPD